MQITVRHFRLLLVQRERGEDSHSPLKGAMDGKSLESFSTARIKAHIVSRPNFRQGPDPSDSFFVLWNIPGQYPGLATRDQSPDDYCRRQLYGDKSGLWGWINYYIQLNSIVCSNEFHSAVTK